MPNYTRRHVPGGTFFFTVRLQDRRSDLLIREIDRLRRAMRATMQTRPFRISDAVVLPSVIHTIWQLPQDDGNFSTRWGLLKSLFSQGLPPAPDRSEAMMARAEKGIWQRRFWEHQLHEANDIAAHRHMIYNAPVQAGLVAHPRDWPHSSFHRAVGAGTWQYPTSNATGLLPWVSRRSA